MKIFKYPIQITDDQTVEMPVGAVILTAQFQGENLCLWASVDEHKRKERRAIGVYGTGNPITERPPIRRVYIGTAQQFGGQLVWHVFEVF